MWTLPAVVVGAFVVASSVLFVWPRSDRLRPVDAILALNGPDEAARTHLALSLMRQGLAPVLLFSQGGRGGPCPKVAGIHIVCFAPQPQRTVGELNFANAYARSHGLRSILVVAGHAQTTRARLLSHRCFDGTSLVVAAPVRWWAIPARVIYEWGAMAKATLVATGCS